MPHHLYFDSEETPVTNSTLSLNVHRLFSRGRPVGLSASSTSERAGNSVKLVCITAVHGAWLNKTCLHWRRDNLDHVQTEQRAKTIPETQWDLLQVDLCIDNSKRMSREVELNWKVIEATSHYSKGLFFLFQTPLHHYYYLPDVRPQCALFKSSINTFHFDSNYNTGIFCFYVFKEFLCFDYIWSKFDN